MSEVEFENDSLLLLDLGIACRKNVQSDELGDEVLPIGFSPESS